VEYVVLDEKGNFVSGQRLRAIAEKGSTRYLTSFTHVDRIRNLDAGFIDRRKSYIISTEGWFKRAEAFKKARIIEKLNIPAEVIVYVRPHVEWANAAWWQWQVWDGNYSSVSDWIADGGYDKFLYMRHIESWREVPGVDRVTVRCQSDDIMKDFLGVLGVEGAYRDYERRNVSLGPTLLKLLLELRELRGIHAGDIDMALARYFHFDEKTPWVIEMGLVREMLSNCLPDSVALSEELQAEESKKMKSDMRWWSADAYEDTKLMSVEEMRLTRDDCISVLRQAIPALIELDRSVAVRKITLGDVPVLLRRALQRLRSAARLR